MSNITTKYKNIPKTPRFVMITTCQGQNFYCFYTSFGRAVIDFVVNYKKSLL